MAVSILSGISGPWDDPEPAPLPDLDLTFGVEPIVAWRVWHLNTYQRRGCEREPRLGPIGVSGYPWHPGRRVEAVCSGGRHDAPWLTCACGLWALRTREEAEKLAAGARTFGSVYLWGRVLEFELGYRAQFAYPRELFVYGDAPKDLSALYGVPVTELDPPLTNLHTSPGSIMFISTNTGAWTSAWQVPVVVSSSWSSDPPAEPTTTGRKAFEQAQLKALRDAEAKKRGRR